MKTDCRFLFKLYSRFRILKEGKLTTKLQNQTPVKLISPELFSNGRYGGTSDPRAVISVGPVGRLRVEEEEQEKKVRWRSKRNRSRNRKSCSALVAHLQDSIVPESISKHFLKQPDHGAEGICHPGGKVSGSGIRIVFLISLPVVSLLECDHEHMDVLDFVPQGLKQ